MKMLRFLSLAIAALGFAVFSDAPAYAAPNVWLCTPANNSGGSKRIVNPNTNGTYTTNGHGCALIASADVSYFLSQGWAQVGEFLSVTAAAQITSSSLTIPAGTYIRDIILQETSGTTVAGGLRFGTTSGGTDVISGIAVSGNSITIATDVSIAKRLFSSTAPQAIFYSPISAVTLGASVWNVTIVYGYF